VFADDYITETIFECDNLEGRNLFDIFTNYSKLILRNNFKDNFYDYKKAECRIRELIFTIDVRCLKTNSQGNKKENESSRSLNFKDKIIQILNNSKTLIGRFSTILSPSTKKDNNPASSILLELKLSKRRQNFDDFLWIEVFN
jgi:hypothetical protein